MYLCKASLTPLNLKIQDVDLYSEFRVRNSGSPLSIVERQKFRIRHAFAVEDTRV